MHEHYLAQFKNQFGFSLVESMITLAIIATLTGVSVPTLSTAISNAQISALSNDLLSTLAAARSHAVTQQQMVIICQLADKQSEKCSTNRQANANWSHGWLVYADKNNNNELDDTDQILQISDQHNAQINIVFNQRGRLRFFPIGSARSAGFYLCLKQLDTAKHVKLLHTGRARIQNYIDPRQHAICRNLGS